MLMQARAPAVADDVLGEQAPTQAHMERQIAAWTGAVMAIAQHRTSGTDLQREPSSGEGGLAPQRRDHLLWLYTLFNKHQPARAPITPGVALTAGIKRTYHHRLAPRNRAIARQRKIGCQPLHRGLNPLTLHHLRQ